MTEIDDHADLIHTIDQTASSRGQARIAELVTTIGEDVALIVGEDRSRYAKLAKAADEIEVERKRGCRLEMKRNRELSLALRLVDRRRVRPDLHARSHAAQFL